MNNSARAFCAMNISDTKTAERLILLLRARQNQINEMLRIGIRITDEAVFYLKMITPLNMDDFQQVLEACCECGMIQGLEDLPAMHLLTQAMVRYAEGNGPIPNRILHPANQYESARKWLNRLGVKDESLLDGLSFIEEDLI